MKKILTLALTLALTLVLTGASLWVLGQPNPLIAQYYSNRYLGNPALAGLSDQLNVSLAHRSQWSDIPGAPLVQNIAADYGFKKAGLGIQATFERAGLERISRVMGSYAYHLPLDGKHQLHFGLSIGVLSQRLALDELEGNPNDPELASYNQRETYIDGDFGLALSGERFSVEASVPNLKRLLDRDAIQLGNVTSFYTAVGYTFSFNDTELQPKVVYRGIRGVGNIVDAGAQFSFAQKQVLITALYHSTETASFGFAMDYKSKYLIGFSHTLQTAAIARYSKGTFEINLRGRF